jgi:hypothetical protein
MVSIPRRDIEDALIRKGFELDDNRDHRFYYFTYQNRRTPIRTKISTGSGYREYEGNLLRAMQQQLKLTFRDLQDLINCPLSRADYEIKLRAQGFIT